MALKDLKNIEDILYGVELPNVLIGQVISSLDKGILKITDNTVSNINDLSIGILELHIYTGDSVEALSPVFNIQDVKKFLEDRNLSLSTYFTISSGVINFDVTKFFEDHYAINNDYYVVLNYITNIISEFGNEDIIVHEISPTRYETRLKYIKTNTPNFNFAELLKFDDGNTDISINDNIFINFGNDNLCLALNILVEDAKSVVIRYYDPIPEQISEMDYAFFSKKKINSNIVRTTYYSPTSIQIPTFEQELVPNWNIKTKEIVAGSTLLNLNSLISNTHNFAQTILSSSIDRINIDYSNYNNFVHFSSARVRLENFYNKLRLIEAYDADISQYNLTAVQLSSSGYLTSSIDTSLISLINEKQVTLGSLTPYEKYLYFESSSYYSGSLGISYDSAWPKLTSTKPYTLYSTTSSIAITWLENQIASASLYDVKNDSQLFNSLPLYLRSDDSNTDYFKFVHMIAEYLDEVFLFIKEITNRDKFKLKEREGISTKFATQLIYQFGSELLTDIDANELASFLLTLSEDTTSISTSPTEVKKNIILKRFLNNLIFFLKSKGTTESIHSLAAMFGLNRTYYDLIEYNSSTPEINILNTSLMPETSLDTVNSEYSLRFDGSQNVRIDWKNFGVNYISIEDTTNKLFWLNPNKISATNIDEWYIDLPVISGGKYFWNSTDNAQIPTASLNGINVYTPSGTNYLRLIDAVGYYFIPSNSDWSMFFVLKNTSGPAISKYDASLNKLFYIANGSDLRILIRDSAGVALDINGVGINAVNWTVIAVTYDNTTKTLSAYANGNSYSTTNLSYVNAGWEIVSGRLFINGQGSTPTATTVTSVYGTGTGLAEWVVTTDKKTTSDINKIAGYLANKYALTWSNV